MSSNASQTSAWRRHCFDVVQAGCAGILQVLKGLTMPRAAPTHQHAVQMVTQH
jgi:hypothetical protein